ncbi:hypothetical protein V8C37DRAFT_366041, partial [Trichoderma ceciliae]
MKLDALALPRGASIKDVIKALCQVDEPTESQFRAFRRFYHEITHFNQIGDVSISISRAGLSSHGDVLEAVARLQSQCDRELKMFQRGAFPDCPSGDREKATRITVQLAFMIDPCSRDGFPMAYRIENEHIFPVKWLPSQSFIQFFHTAFPTESQECWRFSTRRNSLRAWKLKKRLGIQIRPTNDLAEHLVHNPRMKTLAVFHQVEYLKAQIRRTADRSLDEDAETSFAKFDSRFAKTRPTANLLTSGTLPPQLLVETLYSI